MIEFIQNNLWTVPILIFICLLPFPLKCMWDDHKNTLINERRKGK